MIYDLSHPYSAFLGSCRIASGALTDVAVTAHAIGALEQPLLVFSDVSGEQIELDLRGSEDDVRARYAPRTPRADEAPARGRGRPRLGVVAREVTLLPEQWEWLGSQPGGASVALRKLVQEARRNGTERDRVRRAQERSYKLMVSLAGDMAGFEEAARALFANDRKALQTMLASWPRDIRDHLWRLADPDYDPVLKTPE